ncbi:MAG: hypothetical protein JSV52_05395 [Candidatus Zixiibacteriota bacterium]|nr:MAG: hypothetical protein JSV52_05395 [candidate division Zixibacteria bacterium]
MNKSKSNTRTRLLSPANIGILLVGGAYGLFRAIDLAWVCDDAFITFRYAKNFIDGHGLIFNIGERVEGYTSFLWTMLVSMGQLLNAELIRFSQVLSIAAYLGTALLLALLSIRFLRDGSRKSRVLIPIAALAILFMHDYQVWATSGMETSLAALIITLGTYTLVCAKDRWQFAVAGFAMVLAILTRPEAMLCLVMGGIYILIVERPVLRALLYYVIPAFVVYMPYWIVRYNYYGYPFPNTYYAKSGNLAYWSQGWIYLWLFVKTYYVLFVIVPAAIWLILRMRKQLRAKTGKFDFISRVGLLSLLICVPYIAYIIRVGGDFMFARLFIPVIPLCFLVIEAALASIRMSAAVRAVIGVLIIVFTWGSVNQFADASLDIGGIVDERAFYPEGAVNQAQTQGKLLKRVFTGVDSVTVAFYGMRAMLIYYSEFPVAIEAHTGLTDEYLAHMPITSRGRPGHEKQAPYEYLKKRRVLFCFPSPGPLPEVSRIWFGGLEAAMLHWDNRVMEHLKGYPEVRFIDFPAYFDRYIQESYSRPDNQVRNDLAYFKRFYFDFNDDPQRLEQLRLRLGG